jgi:hypothetical protein
MPVGGLEQPQRADQRREPLAVLGQVDRIGAGAQDRDARRRQFGGELQRGLPAELDDHAHQRAARLLDMQHSSTSSAVSGSK